MDHVAIDLGGRESQICIRKEDGSICWEKRCATKDLSKLFAAREPSRVILETCAEAFHVADQARASGHDVRVVAASLVRALGVGARRTKTDKRDAQVLSEVSARIDLQGVHVPTLRAREHKSIVRARDALVRSRTQLINASRGWLRTWAIRPRSGAPQSFPERARAAVGAELPEHIEAMLDVIENLSLRIKETETTLSELAKEDPICRRLMTVPGIGPITSLLYVATLDDIERFDSAAKVGAYVGLTPGEHSSSDKVRRTGITKAGSSPLRRVLVQAALSIKRFRRTDPMVQWAMKIQERRGRHIATVALARKLAGVLFALWRHNDVYNPSRAAQATTERSEAP